MNTVVTLTQGQLPDFLLNVALVRPVFIWGPPGHRQVVAGAAVRRARSGLPCVSLLGSQLAPEDLIGVPQIVDGTSRFCPPRMIARDEPYCLFLDELNACSHEVQKAFYSLIHERRIGEYDLPAGLDRDRRRQPRPGQRIVKPMSSALLNRMVHVHLQVSHRDWLDWAEANEHPPAGARLLQLRPDHLWSQPPKHEEPFSTPRSWHMLSDALHALRRRSRTSALEVLAYGCLTPAPRRAVQGVRQAGAQHVPADGDPQGRDRLAARARGPRRALLPGPVASAPSSSRSCRRSAPGWPPSTRELAHRAKALLKELAAISLEIAQLVVAKGEDGAALPDWFLVEVVRDLPRLVERKDGA